MIDVRQLVLGVSSLAAVVVGLLVHREVRAARREIRSFREWMNYRGDRTDRRLDSLLRS